MENPNHVTNRTEMERSRRTPVEPRAERRVVEPRPRLDVFENGEAIRIVADVPGVDAACADVEVELPHLRIDCTRAVAGGTTIRYCATLTLPNTIESESLAAELRNGVLEITMHKSPKARARRIPISTA